MRTVTLAVLSFCLFSISHFANAAITCEEKISLQCPQGYVDGCTVKDSTTSNGLLTTHHVCVDKKMAQMGGGVSCELEVYLVCSVPGETDGCYANPPVVENHMCVLK